MTFRGVIAGWAACFLLSSCAYFQINKPECCLPLGDWEVTRYILPADRRLKSVAPAQSFLRKTFSFRPDILIFPQGFSVGNCRPQSWNYVRRTAQHEEIFDDGHAGSFSLAEAGIPQGDIKLAKAECGFPIYGARDNKHLYVPMAGVLLVLEPAWRDKSTATATPEPESGPTPVPTATMEVLEIRRETILKF